MDDKVRAIFPELNRSVCCSTIASALEKLEKEINDHAPDLKFKIRLHEDDGDTFTFLGAAENEQILERELLNVESLPIKFSAWKGKCMVCEGAVMIPMCLKTHQWQFDKCHCILCGKRYSVDFENMSEKEWMKNQ